MIVQRTGLFDRWLRRLRDDKAIARIQVRIARLELGNAGDLKSLGGGLMELRIDYGPGYRLYATKRSSTVVLLLCGGDKSTQANDIARARAMIEEL